MLKPFQIRDLHGSPTEEDAYNSLDCLPQGHHGQNTSRRSGIVHLSASDYDEIALSHPRARLTYVDDDDREIITVGSSLELSQRLDEPIYDMSTRSNPTQESTIPETMHIFDIRRSNSVTELWKRFEYKAASRETEDTKTAVESTEDKPTSLLQDSNESNTGVPTNDGSESLLAAFETEMAKILSASETGTTNNAEDSPSSTEVPNQSASSGRRINPAEALAQAVHHLINGAEMIGSEVTSRLPELEHQLEHHLQNAQRVLPETVGSTVQAAVASLEAQMRNLTNALNNARSASDRRTSNVFRGEIPTPAEAVDSLYTMAAELGQMGHTLYSAFETEFGPRTRARDANQPLNESLQNPAPAGEAAVNRDPSGDDSVSSSKTEKETKVPLAADETDTTSRGLGSEAREEPRPFTSGTEEPGSAQCVPSQQDEPSELPESVPHDAPTFDLPYRPRSWRRFPHPPHYRSHHHHHPHPHSRPHPPPPPPHRHHDIHPTPHPPHHPHRHHHHQPHPFPPPAPPHQHHHVPPPPPHPPHPFHPSPTPRPPWQAHAPFPPSFSPHPRAHNHGPWHPAWPFFRPHQEHHSEAPTAAADQVPDAGASALRSANAVLFIGNVGFNVSEKTIRDVFAAKGFLVDVHLPLDAETRKHAGFGYLHFPSIHAARAALEALQGTHIDGHSINLELSDHSPITSLHPGQLPEWGHARRPSELRSSANPSSGTNLERREVGQDDKNEESITAWEKRPIPLSAADLCSSDKGTDQEPKGKKVLSTTPDDFPHLTRDLEQSRFPPMSQIDAHALAHHRRDPDTPMLGAPAPECHASHENDVAGGLYQLQSTPGSFPDDDSDERRSGPFQEPAQISGTGHDDHCKPRRSKSMRYLNRNGDRSPWRGLRRRATERHSLRHGSQNSVGGFHDEGCAYDNYSNTFGHSRPRSPLLSQEEISVSDDNERQPDPRQSAIDDCIVSLIGLGYENSLEGGIQRIAVYAAAADGKISDAIEMIEEERRAYEQQGL